MLSTLCFIRIRQFGDGATFQRNHSDQLSIVVRLVCVETHVDKLLDNPNHVTIITVLQHENDGNVVPVLGTTTYMKPVTLPMRHKQERVLHEEPQRPLFDNFCRIRRELSTRRNFHTLDLHLVIPDAFKPSCTLNCACTVFLRTGVCGSSGAAASALAGLEASDCPGSLRLISPFSVSVLPPLSPTVLEQAEARPTDTLREPRFSATKRGQYTNY